MADNITFTLSLRDQLTPKLREVKKAMNDTATATDQAAKASDSRKFGFDKAARGATTLGRAADSGKKAVTALGTSGSSTSRAMQALDRATGGVASKAKGLVSSVGTSAKNAAGKMRSEFKSKTDQITDDFEKAGRSSGSKFVGGLKKAAVGIGAALGVAGIGALGASMVTEAGNAEQALGAIDAVFKESSKSMREFAMTADQSVGLSVNQFGEIATVLGAQLKNGGTSIDQLAGKTTDLVKVGADMSAMFGGTAAEAVGAISSALRGERDPIERYGVSLNQAAVDAKAASLGFEKVGGTLSAEASQAATIAIIMEQTADSHGRFAAEAGTVMNEQQKLTAGWANMKTEIGNKLIPYVSVLFGWLSARLPGALDVVTGTIDGVVGAIKTVVGWFSDLSAWVQDNQVLAVGLGAALLTLTGILTGQAVAAGVVSGAMAVWKSITAAAAVVQNVFNLALLASPWTWVAVAVVGLIAALTWFFTKTETGKAIVVGAWEAIKGAVSGVVSWFQTTAMPFLSSVWSGIAAGAMWLWNNVMKPVWTGIQWGFLALVTAVMLYWEFYLKPMFNALAGVALWVWNSVLKPTWNAMVAGWNWLVAGVMWAWENLLRPAWNAVAAAGLWLWNSVLKPVFGWVQIGWSALVLGVQMYWNTILKPVFTGLASVALWLWNNALKPVFGWIKTGWQALGTGMAWVRDNVLVPVMNGVKAAGDRMWEGLNTIFGWIKTGIEKVGNAFNTAKDVIGKAWQGIQDKAKGPAKFIVETVYNEGIVPVWNRAAKIFNMEDKKLDRVNAKFAEGGRVRGPGTGTSDSITADLSNGEFVVNAQATAEHLPLLHAINGPRGVGYQSAWQGPAFAGGGLMDAADWWIAKGARASRHSRFNGGRKIKSGHSANSKHYTDEAVDFNYGPGGTNRTEQAFFDRHIGEFKSLFPALSSLWRTTGHFNHLHVDTGRYGHKGGGSGGFGGGFDFGPLTKLLAKVTGFKNQSGLWGTGIMAASKSIIDAAIAKINPFSGGGDTNAGDPGAQSGVGQWRNVVIAALKHVGQSTSDGMVNTVLRRLKQESGGNPRAINNWDVNARRGTPSKGLMQVIDPTFAAYRDKKLGNNIWDPMQNIVASMRYALKRYGSLPSAYNRKGGYAEGGLVGLFDNGGPWMPNTLGYNGTGMTEYVLSPEQSGILTSGLARMSDAAAGGGGGTMTIERIDVRIEGDVHGVEDLEAVMDETARRAFERIMREWEERR